jgi:hypothetical protein
MTTPPDNVEVLKRMVMMMEVTCYDCGKTITDFASAERVDIDPSLDKVIWFCGGCKRGHTDKEGANEAG